MADTGENRQIASRTNAKEVETVRASTKMISQERSTARANDAAFGGEQQNSPPAKLAKASVGLPKPPKT
jgi:hypothetical protein